MKITWKAQRLVRKHPLKCITAIIIILVTMYTVHHNMSLHPSSSSSLRTYAYKPQINWKPRNRPMDHITHYDLNTHSDALLILTPMAKFNTQYWDNLVALSYPKDLTDVGFIIPRTIEGDETLKQLETTLKTHPQASLFHKITILRQDGDSLQSQSESKRHAFKVQKRRRAFMAQGRNSLLGTTMAPYISWVLWLDADIVESPPSLIEDLMRLDKPVLAANCFQRFFAQDRGKMSMRPYDFNNWAESDEGLRIAASLPEDEVILEGYAEMPTYRALMGHFYVPHADSDTVVPLDGVGGTCLLVKAAVHRDGANFPTFPFKHLIETEGFAMMAKRLGYGVYGLPNYIVFHVNE